MPEWYLQLFAKFGVKYSPFVGNSVFANYANTFYSYYENKVAYLNMLNIVNNKVYARDLHTRLESKAHFSIWFNKKVEEADLQEVKDFTTLKLKSTGGRPQLDYELTIETAKEICLLQQSAKGKEIRRYLISLSEKVDNFQLLTPKQSAYCTKVVQCLQYIANQKHAFAIHQKQYMDEIENANFTDFARYRADIIGWDKQKVEEAFNKWQIENRRNLRTLKTMNDRMNAIDPAEAIRVAVLDILFSQHEDKDRSAAFANTIKIIAEELDVKTFRTIEANLIDSKREILPITTIKLN